jgi:Spy/CpxP family protein refolding chaperone
MLNFKFKKTAVVVALMACVLGLATAVALAQESRRERRAGGQDVEGLMEAYVISKLQEALDLTDDQFAKMIVAQKKLGEYRRSYRRDRAATLQQMRQALRSAESREERLESLLNQLEERQLSFENQQRSGYKAIDAILDIRQRARYRILEQEIQRRFQQMIREVRGRQNLREPRP